MIPLLFMLATTAAADSPEVAARETVAILAGAMSENNAEKFLAYVGPEVKSALEPGLRALLLRYEITSSISPLSNEGDDRKRTLELDWYVEIRARENEMSIERRRQTIRCVVEKGGKKKRWLVTSVDSEDFFAPPKPQP
jgi:hypothetical protein